MVVTLSNNSTINSCGVPMTDNVAHVLFQTGTTVTAHKIDQIHKSDIFSLSHIYKIEKGEGGEIPRAFTSNVPCCDAWGDKFPVHTIPPLWQNMGLIAIRGGIKLCLSVSGNGTRKQLLRSFSFSGLSKSRMHNYWQGNEINK